MRLVFQMEYHGVLDHETSDNNESFPFLNNNGSLLVSSGKVNISHSISSAKDFCSPSWAALGMTYGAVHGYTSLVLCLFGSLMNVLNLVVLTRREMVSPTNLILSALALADLLNMIEYIPFVLFMKILSHIEDRKGYGWALYLLIHANFSQVEKYAETLVVSGS
jgi:hypothetical protein